MHGAPQTRSHLHQLHHELLHPASWAMGHAHSPFKRILDLALGPQNAVKAFDEVALPRVASYTFKAHCGQASPLEFVQGAQGSS